MTPPILREGETCWRKVHARRARFVIDAAEYFPAVADAIAGASHAVFILGWDLDSRTRLYQDEAEHPYPVTLGPFLDAVVRDRPNLDIYILIWDFSVLFALEREPMPLFKLGLLTHERVHFAFDDKHPMSASHHQKFVVVDDALAFCGGIDITRNRWDTPDHRAYDPRRTNPGGKTYTPFHDVQMAVEGTAAAQLGDLARERWYRATGEHIDPVGTPGALWPERFQPHLRDVEVAIARTVPRFRHYEEVREVERLFLDSIRAATKWMYIENQYFTSHVIADAIADRLSEDDGPEVLVVLPLRPSGWLEETTMGVLLSRVLQKLIDADRRNRFRAVYPVVPDCIDPGVYVHAKVMVVDDRCARVGSANISNRSLGLDSECDLALESDGDAEIERAIATFRNTLLAEHLGTTPDEVARELAQTGSLIATVKAHERQDRALRLLPFTVHQWIDQLIPATELIDPERPMEMEELLDQFFVEDVPQPAHSRVWWTVAITLSMVALALVWRFTPLYDFVRPSAVAAALASVRGTPWMPVVVLGGFVLASWAQTPVTVLILLCAALFGPWEGMAYALTGSVLSAVTTFGIGHVLGRDTVRRIAGSKLNKISKHMARRGLLVVVTLRLVPVAPFGLVNLVAGASRIRLRDFALGTVLGMAPGIIGVTVFERSLRNVITDPGVGAFLLLGAVLLVLAAAAAWIQRRLGAPGGDDTHAARPAA